MPKKLITLPNKKEMLARLRKTEDPLQVQEGLYQLLVQYAGEQKTARQIAIMLQVNIFKYTDWKSSPKLTQLHRNTSAFIDALVDDKDVAREAKDVFARAIA